MGIHDLDSFAGPLQVPLYFGGGLVQVRFLVTVLLQESILVHSDQDDHLLQFPGMGTIIILKKKKD